MKCGTRVNLALPFGGTPNRSAVVVHAEPAGLDEGWFGEGVVGAEVSIEVVTECVGILRTENPTRCHAGQRSCDVALLAVDANRAIT